MREIDYYQTARENESLFRNILIDLKSNRDKRPMGYCIPENLDSESDLDEIFKKYSEGRNRMGEFTITNFAKLSENSVEISFQDVAPLSGGGVTLEYIIDEKDSLKFKKAKNVFMC